MTGRLFKIRKQILRKCTKAKIYLIFGFIVNFRMLDSYDFRFAVEGFDSSRVKVLPDSEQPSCCWKEGSSDK